ncbi:MAG TPA: DEAD/DEAH box helicase [Polyangiaceae bacterium]|nr:DEAD/DEAH box helicase [Polyangiaceae bacterium]
MFAEASPQPGPAPIPFVPCVRLFVERMAVEQANDDGVSDAELDVPVLALAFEYAGTRIRASDRRKHFFVGQGGSLALVERDLAGEARAQCLLEGFGAVELDCASSYAADLDSQADYIVQVGGNVHTLCSFTAYALPQLESLGFKIEIAGDYPYQVVSPDVPWYANVDSDDGRSDWFSLELGIEIDGKRVNLVPALLELLEECADISSLEALLRMPARFRVVPVGENRYLPVPPERLRSVLQVLLELYRGEELADGALCFPGSRAGTVAKLDLALDGAAALLWGGDTDLRKRGRAISRAKQTENSAPLANLNATLRPYQQEGVDWLQHLIACDVGGVLADDMGLGKTLQTIAHLSTEKASGRMGQPALVLMPTSLIGNWQRELKKFAPHLKVLVLHGPKRDTRRGELPNADVVLTTYPLILRDLEHFRDRDFHLLILDEAQAIKNPRSQINKAVGALSARHRLCLSGTPVENNLEELWSLFDFLMPGFLGDADRFRTTFRTPIERDGNAQKLEALRAAVAPFILRRMKETVARDLPPKTELVRPVEIAGDQRELYESIRAAAHSEVRTAIRKKGIPGSTITILDALMKLRQVCCDPRLVSVPSARTVQSSAKFTLFFELLTTQLEQGRRVLVFSQFTRMLALLSEGLKERNISQVELTGSTIDRQKVVDAFEARQADVFLISLKAGGTGLNLTSADTVIHYDPWWNAAAQSQATDRAYRIGQTKPVFVYNLIVAGSVEERMLRLQQKKQQLAATLLGSGGVPSRLTEGDLEDLFAPLAD